MTGRQTKIKAPAHLSKGAGALYAQIHAQYVLEAHHDAILIKSLEAFDRAEAARLIVERDGVLVTSRLGEIKASPAVQIERDARAAFLAGIKALNLDLELGPPPPSPRHRRA